MGSASGLFGGGSSGTQIGQIVEGPRGMAAPLNYLNCDVEALYLQSAYPILSSPTKGIGTLCRPKPWGALDPSDFIGLGQKTSDVDWSTGLAKFFAGALHGIFSSPDGKAWKSVFFSIGVTILKIRANVNGLVFAFDTNKNVYYSSDGVIWTAIASTSATAVDVAWNGSVYFFLNSNSTLCYTTPDLATFTLRDIHVAVNSQTLSSVAWSGTVFAIVAAATNGFATSADGITWTGRTGAAAVAATGHVIWANSLFLAAGGAGVRVQSSPDGITWTLADASTSGAAAIAWTGTRYILGINTAGGVASSTVLNGAFSNPAAPNGSTSCTGIAWSGTAACAVQAVSQGIYGTQKAQYTVTSPDGSTWTWAVTGLRGCPIQVDGNANGALFAAGELDAASLLHLTNKYFYLCGPVSDGSFQWTQMFNYPANSFGGLHLNHKGAVYNGLPSILVGNGANASQDQLYQWNGSTWTNAAQAPTTDGILGWGAISPTAIVVSVTSLAGMTGTPGVFYEDGIFIACGTNGGGAAVVAYSSDGTNWSPLMVLDAADTLTVGAYNGGRWCFLSSTNLYRIDGAMGVGSVTKTALATIGFAGTVNDLLAVGGLFWIFTTTAIYISVDGTIWTEVGTWTTSSPLGGQVGWDGRRCYVADYGAVVFGDRTLRLPMGYNPGQQFVLPAQRPAQPDRSCYVRAL